jgi:hypothetical protein
MISEKNAMPGDLAKFEVKVDDTDITESVMSVTVFQDIFSPTWTASIDLNDTNNVMMNVPIRPGSKVTVSVKTDLKSETDGEKTFKFVVFGIGDKQFENSLQQFYTISCVSQDFIRNQGIRVLQSYRNLQPDQICGSIIEEYLNGTIDTDSASNQVSVIISNLSPFTAAHLLCKIAIFNGAADMMFFMRDDKKYAMKSIESMYNESPVFRFKMRPSNIRDNSGSLEEDYNLCITNYHFEHYDVMSNISSGLYANKLVQFNFIDKTWNEKKFKFGDDVAADAQKKPWKDDELFEQENANISFLPKHPGLSGNGETMLDSAADWSGSRRSSLMKLEQDKLIVQLPGGVKGWEALGHTIEIDLPSQQDFKNEIYDKQFKGRYLVVAISHYFGKHSYFINYELIKKRHEVKIK